MNPHNSSKTQHLSSPGLRFGFNGFIISITILGY
jgi:hypothetical protein